MAWQTQFLLRRGQLEETPFPLRKCENPPDQIPEGTEQTPLIFIAGEEYFQQLTCYTQIQINPIWLDTPTGRTWVDLSASITDITPQEQAAIRDWLRARSLVPRITRSAGHPWRGTTE